MILINTAENRSFEHFSTTMSTPDTTLSPLPPARVSPCGGCPDGVEVCVHQKFVKCSKKHQSSFERFIFEPLIGRFIACFCWWKKVGTPCRNFRWRRSTRDHKRPQETTRDHRFGHVSISLDFHFQSSSHLTELRMFNHFQLCRIMFSKISWLKTRTTPRWWLQTSSKLLAGSSRQVRWKYLPIFETTTWAPRSHIFFGFNGIQWHSMGVYGRLARFAQCKLRVINNSCPASHQQEQQHGPSLSTKQPMQKESMNHETLLTPPLHGLPQKTNILKYLKLS